MTGPIDIPDNLDRREYRESVSKVPQKKVVAATTGAGVGGAASVVVIWIIEAAARIDIPESVELASVVLFTAGLAFIGGYFKKS